MTDETTYQAPADAAEPDTSATPSATAPADASEQEAGPARPALDRVGAALGPSARWMAVTAAAVLLIVLVAARLLLFPTPSGQPMDYAVVEGSSVARVAGDLASRGVVPSSFLLKVWIAASGSTSRILPGDYRFQRGTAYGQVVADLRKGTNIPAVEVIIPEGFTVRQIAKRLERKVGIPAKGFQDQAFHGAKQLKFPYLKDVTTPSLEGYLFPKTYMVRKDATAADVLQMMVKQYGKDTAGLPWGRASKLGLTQYEVLTVASMIEKESPKQEERRRIAGVIYNRLENGLPPADPYGPRLMRLQIDPSVLYALGRDSGSLKASEYRLKKGQYVDWRYNTYIVEGLPPGPIANPGVSSIYAALVPESNDYYFYVAKGDGSHEFAATWDEFQATKRRLGYGK